MQISDKPQTGLVGDIGATHARFALAHDDGTLSRILTLPTAAFANLAQAMQAYAQQADTVLPAHASIAIANPIDGDWLRMTNTDWAFSIEQTRRGLGLQSLRMLNDWEAMALAVATLSPEELMPIGQGEAVANAPRGLIGAGSGLGVSALVPTGCGQWVPVAGEGGHVTLSPGNAQETAILHVLWKRWPHVSAERVISGMGLENLYTALAEISGRPHPPLSAAEISQRAQSAEDTLCLQAVEMLCVFLGRTAGNLALTLAARGGIYIGGGVMQHLRPHLPRSGFRAAFEDKGRFAAYLRAIPTWLIEAENAGLRGAATALGWPVRVHP